MHYLGGKFRTAKYIAEEINKRRAPGQLYVELFCGACWVSCLVDNPRILSDINYDLICMWRRLQDGWEPPSIVSEKEYEAAKKSQDDSIRGFIGFGCSYSGKFFGGYARSGNRNYALNARNSLLRKVPKLLGAQFTCWDYEDLYTILMSPQNSIIYCDPPYENTTRYYGTPPFDYVKFWENMRKWSENNTVLISSYEAPQDFTCIREFLTKTDMHCKSGKEPRIEKLFMRK